MPGAMSSSRARQTTACAEARQMRVDQSRGILRMPLLISAVLALFILLQHPTEAEAARRHRVRSRSKSPAGPRGEEDYSVPQAAWGFRVESSISNRRASLDSPRTAGVLVVGNATRGRLSGVDRGRIRESVHFRARAGSPAAPTAGGAALQSTGLGEEVSKALADALSTRNSSAVPFTNDFLLSYLDTRAMGSLLRAEVKAAEPGGGPLLAGHQSKGRAGRAGVDVSTATLDAAAEGGRELVGAAVDALSRCAQAWKLDTESLSTAAGEAADVPSQACSRKLNLVLLLDTSLARSGSGGSSQGGPFPRGAAWWRNATLMRGEVLREELNHQGHHVVILDAAVAGRASALKASLKQTHRQRSLDACVCVGRGCWRQPRLAYIARVCRFFGITVVHDPADVSSMQVIQSSAHMMDMVASSSRLMQIAVEQLSGKPAPVVKVQHNNYAAIGQTPEEAMARPIRRVLLQIEGATGGAEAAAVRGAVHDVARSNGWEVVEGVEAVMTLGNARSRRAVAAKRNPGRVGETALGLDQLQAAVIWPGSRDHNPHRCTKNSGLLLHLMAAGIPTVAFPTLASVEIALAHGYHLLASKPQRVTDLLQQLGESPELRALSSRRALEIAAKHRARSAADNFARRLCELKHMARYVAEEKAALVEGRSWHCLPNGAGTRVDELRAV